MNGAVQPRIDEPLLHRTQEFLRARLQGRTPDTVLAAAWDDFYRVYDGLIRRFVLAQGLRGADVDDCVQEVWVEVVSRLEAYEHDPDRPGLRAWLSTIVRNRATDQIRRRARRPAQSLEELREAGREPGTAEADPAHLFECAWERLLLATLVSELRREVSDTNYRLLCLRLLEGRAVADVAAALGLAPEQAWYRQYRLLKKLQVRLALYTGKPFGGAGDATPGAQGCDAVRISWKESGFFAPGSTSGGASPEEGGTTTPQFRKEKAR
jgi:RNA polymerase sigma factor (sigma-70 family)